MTYLTMVTADAESEVWSVNGTAWVGEDGDGGAGGEGAGPAVYYRYQVGLVGDDVYTAGYTTINDPASEFDHMYVQVVRKVGTTTGLYPIGPYTGAEGEFAPVWVAGTPRPGPEGGTTARMATSDGRVQVLSNGELYEADVDGSVPETSEWSYPGSESWTITTLDNQNGRWPFDFRSFIQDPVESMRTGLYDADGGDALIDANAAAALDPPEQVLTGVWNGLVSGQTYVDPVLPDVVMSRYDWVSDTSGDGDSTSVYWAWAYLDTFEGMNTDWFTWAAPTDDEGLDREHAGFTWQWKLGEDPGEEGITLELIYVNGAFNTIMFRLDAGEQNQATGGLGGEGVPLSARSAAGHPMGVADTVPSNVLLYNYDAAELYAYYWPLGAYLTPRFFKTEADGTTTTLRNDLIAHAEFGIANPRGYDRNAHLINMASSEYTLLPTPDLGLPNYHGNWQFTGGGEGEIGSSVGDLGASHLHTSEYVSVVGTWMAVTAQLALNSDPELRPPGAGVWYGERTYSIATAFLPGRERIIDGKLDRTNCRFTGT